MKIALVGYGKMGKAIEEIALERGHSISYKINFENKEEIKLINPANTDVAIEFTNPSSCIDNLHNLIDYGVKTVCGSTGIQHSIESIKNKVSAKNASLVYATNFSLGVNLFFALNEKFAKMTESLFPTYRVEIEEIHHTQKLDAPSGTAITLAEKIISRNSNYNNWKLNENQIIEQNSIPIKAVRTDGVPGTHHVVFKSNVDQIVLTHEAFNRKGFATGAVIAAEFLQTQIGFFTMQDVLKL